jgi:hypothetical protein
MFKEFFDERHRDNSLVMSSLFLYVAKRQAIVVREEEYFAWHVYD